MGQIGIDINGSFPAAMRKRVAFGAMESGHAAALGEAIAYLSSLLPSAIRQDHALHDEGAFPRDNFGLELDDNALGRQGGSSDL